MPQTILGISAFYHDAAACLVRNGDIIAAAQEERFTRKKHDQSFPQHAIQFCLREGRCSVDDLDSIVFYDKPFLKFNRLLETHVAAAPKGVSSFVLSIPMWLKEKLWLSDEIAERLAYKGKVLFTEHHESHAASAFFPSPFEHAVIVTVDGVGEYATTSIATGKKNHITLLKEQHFPHSLGLLYSACTYFTGFKVNSGEYKVMGLAPYGIPKYVKTIYDNLIDVRSDGSFTMNMDYFDYAPGLKMTNDRIYAEISHEELCRGYVSHLHVHYHTIGGKHRRNRLITIKTYERTDLSICRNAVCEPDLASAPTVVSRSRHRSVAGTVGANACHERLL